MVSLTVAIDPDILETARLEAQRRETSIDQMVCDYVASVAHESERSKAKTSAEREENRRQLLELMYSGPLGVIDRPLTREEIYAERTRWPRS